MQRYETEGLFIFDHDETLFNSGEGNIKNHLRLLPILLFLSQNEYASLTILSSQKENELNALIRNNATNKDFGREVVPIPDMKQTAMTLEAMGVKFALAFSGDRYANCLQGVKLSFQDNIEGLIGYLAEQEKSDNKNALINFQRKMIEKNKKNKFADNNIYFIDDSKNNIDAAKKLGINTILVDKNNLSYLNELTEKTNFNSYQENMKEYLKQSDNIQTKEVEKWLKKIKKLSDLQKLSLLVDLLVNREDELKEINNKDAENFLNSFELTTIEKKYFYYFLTYQNPAGVSLLNKLCDIAEKNINFKKFLDSAFFKLILKIKEEKKSENFLEEVNEIINAQNNSKNKKREFLLKAENYCNNCTDLDELNKTLNTLLTDKKYQLLWELREGAGKILAKGLSVFSAKSKDKLSETLVNTRYEFISKFKSAAIRIAKDKKTLTPNEHTYLMKIVSTPKNVNTGRSRVKNQVEQLIKDNAICIKKG